MPADDSPDKGSYFLSSIKEPRQSLGALYPDPIESIRVESQSFENGWRDLCGLYGRCEGFGSDPRVRYQNHHVGVVVGEAAMFRLLLRAAGIGHANIRSDDDIRGARVSRRRDAWCVEQ